VWLHPITVEQINKLEVDWGVNGSNPLVGWYEVLQPQASKVLACGDRGSGAMLDWQEIVAITKNRLILYQQGPATAGT
jgi:phosphopantothenoylcysteine decarboxylase